VGPLARHLASESAALLFGSEKFGLSNEDLSYCHWLLRIGIREEHGSMNLGQAVAVCLYECDALHMQAHDAEVWLGILRQIRWKRPSGRFARHSR
jgi:tRNA C32,U32 (ribose-2'-O)-methylase TrmJ